MVQDISGKEKLYNFIAGGGIKVIQAIFPEYFAKEPLRPTDRYIEYPFVLKNIPNKPRVILDVGCSGSMFPLLLEALGYNVMGIDIRDYPIRDKIAFVQNDITKSHLPDDYFDIVTAISTIEHVGLKDRYGGSRNSRGDIKAIDEIYRILKLGGLFLLTVPFGTKPKVLKNHRIYNINGLECLMQRFEFKYTTVPSPEADYSIALVKATK